MAEEAEDPFAFITQQARVHDSAIPILRTVRFLGEEEVIPPPSGHGEAPEMYHTPEEQLPSLSSLSEAEAVHEQHDEEEVFSPSKPPPALLQQSQPLEFMNKSKLTSSKPHLDINASLPTLQGKGLVVIDANNANSEKQQKKLIQDAASLPTLQVQGFRKLPDWSDQFEVGHHSRRQPGKGGSSSSLGGGDKVTLGSSRVYQVSSESLDFAKPSFVRLTDLVDPKENDLLVTAIKAGWNFPRPRSWKS